MAKDNNYNLNNDNHSISHILVFICLLLILANIWFTANIYVMVKDQIDVQNGRINRRAVMTMDENGSFH